MPSLSTRQSVKRHRISDWRDDYFAAVLEIDAQRAAVKILSARQAMQQRLVELQSTASASIDELRDLHSALTYLDILFSYLDESPSAARLSATA